MRLPKTLSNSTNPEPFQAIFFHSQLVIKIHFKQIGLQVLPLLTLLYLPFLAKSQDYVVMAQNFQAKDKNNAVAILSSEIIFEFKVDPGKKRVTVSEKKHDTYLSLRYNQSIIETEVYDDHSEILDFSGSSSLKQKLNNTSRICGTYTSEGYFYDDSKFCAHEIKLKELGEVWEINVEKKFTDAKYLTTLYFHDSYPVVSRKITFIIPQEIDIQLREYNFEDFDITKTETSKGSKKIVSYLSKDLKAKTKERFTRGPQFNFPHVLILTMSTTIGGKQVNILSSTKDLYAWYRSLTSQLKPKDDVFKPTVNKLIQGKKTDEEKIAAIYYWVQDNIRYIAFENGIAAFKPDEAHEVFEKKYGDCKGMANLTKEMLKVAGYDARLSWIGTKRIRYDYSIPSLAVDNHMICTVLTEDKRYFLDATEKYIPLGKNAERIQDRQILIENGDSYILDVIPATDKKQDLELKEIKFSINNETLEGDYKTTLNGEAKKNFLYGYHYTKSEKKQTYIKDYLSDDHLKVSDIKIPDLEQRTGPLILKSNLSFENAANSFNNEIYLDIDPSKDFKNWELKEERQSDLDFGEKIYKREIVELEIPAGYTVSHLPEGLNIHEREFSFIISYTNDGKKISYQKELSIDQGIIQKTIFKKWNSAVKELSEAYENQIILKK